MTSAGVTYAITQACSIGNLSTCSCDSTKKEGEMTSDGWKWGGCSSDINYGTQLARKFMDAREIAKNARSFMNLHNNRAGRKSVKSNMITDCKCHGVSGSCTVKTCWTTLPPFRAIGDALRKRYKKAKLVVPYLGGRTRRPISLFLKRSKRPHRKPRRSHLVYLDKSPNYCDHDESTGSLGTIGRSCNRTSKGPDGCDLMCCGRGYNTHQYVRVWQCHCKFFWCCRVDCAKCQNRTELYTCK
ncbi:protein Wnt-7-like [Physella acuta]|uniref:protein Wnt-7-like n=1 Tax=Physella acuta TaxID=109671 RepID=UPI0027DDA752|nr:protein Wnt-7-like [Physella acuta]